MKKKMIKDAKEDPLFWVKAMNFYHPPLFPMPDIPMAFHHGAFCTKRRFDVHTGTDLFVPPNTPVYSIENGEVIKIRHFTGEKAGCGHWNETMAVDIEGVSFCACYGEIEPIEGLKEGDIVKRGDMIGKVIPVLKKFKGKPTSMLHFSLHSRAFGMMMKNNEDNSLEPMFDMQIDPTNLLIQLKNKSDIMELQIKIAMKKGYGDKDE